MVYFEDKTIQITTRITTLKVTLKLSMSMQQVMSKTLPVKRQSSEGFKKCQFILLNIMNQCTTHVRTKF